MPAEQRARALRRVEESIDEPLRARIVQLKATDGDQWMRRLYPDLRGRLWSVLIEGGFDWPWLNLDEAAAELLEQVGNEIVGPGGQG
jgi:hypothetical protein